MRDLTEILPVAVYTCDLEGRITYANAKAKESWGLDGDQLKDRRFSGWLRGFRTDGTLAEPHFSPLAEVMRTKEPVREQRLTVDRVDGTRVTILQNVQPLLDDAGNVTGCLCAFETLSTSPRTEAERRLAAIVESSDDAIVSKDLNGIVKSWNAGAQALFGYTAEEMLGRSILTLIPPERHAEEDYILGRIRRGEKTEHYETVRRRKDGQHIHVSLTVSPVKDENGRIVGASKIARDVTAQKLAQQELNFREQLYQAIGESIDYGIWVCDADGRNVFASNSFLKMVGMTQEECSTLGWMKALAPEQAAETEKAWKNAVREGTFWEREHHFKGRDGKLHPVLARGVPVRDADGKITHWVGINLDISAFKKVESTLSRRTKDLEALNQVGSLLVGERDLNKIVQGVTDAGVHICGAQFGAFFYNVINDQGESYTLYTLSGVPREAFSKFPMPRNTALFGPTFRGEGVIRVDDILQDPRYGKSAPHHGMPAGHLPVRSYLAVPVISRSGEVLGGLFFGHATPGVFSKEAEETITTLSAQAAIAVDNARLHQAAEREMARLVLAQQEARAREQQLRLVTDHAPVFLVQCDRDFRYKFVNQTYADRFGMKADDLVGKHLSDVVGTDALRSFEHQVRRVLSGETVNFEMEVPYQKIGRRWVDVTYVPERGMDGEVVGLVAVITDSTARKQAEKELERARDEALAASKAKDDFLAALSHELRTPLNPVLLLASDGAVNADYPPEVRQDFESIRKNIELEARLIDDLLDLTRITHNKLVLERREVDAHAVLQDAVANSRLELQSKKLTLEVDLAAKHSRVVGDPVRLQQVFWNILKNAVKFTPAGAILVRTSSNEETGLFTAEIADTGIGMTEEELRRAFDAFAQGDHAQAGPSNRFGGLGLGLAISRSLINLHHGRVRASSRGRGQGSVFTIELPFVRSEKSNTLKSAPVVVLPPEVPEPAPSAPTKQLLVVDDHAPTRSTLKNLLTRRGYSVVLAESFRDAREQAAGRHFDLLISDIGLPDGDGCDLMRELRRTQPGLRGIALSGYGMDEDIARTRAAGFVEHLIKPINMEKLQATIAQLVASN